MRLLLTLAALLVLPACDSGSDTSVAGTWDTQSTRDSNYFTVSQSQTIRDTNRAGTGGLVVTGALAGTLQYVFGTPTGVYALDTPLVSGNARIAIQTRNGSIELLGLTSGGTTREFALVSFTGPVAFTGTATYLEVTSALFREAGTNAEARVGGRLTFATRALTAGQEALYAETVSDRAEASVLQVTFADGGVYRQVNSDLTTLAGTWLQVNEDEVRIRTGSETSTEAFAVSGSTLTLSSVEGLDNNACDAECLENAAAFLGIAPGTLSDFRSEFVRTFRRGSESDPARPGARAAAPRPAGVPGVPAGWPFPAR